MPPLQLPPPLSPPISALSTPPALASCTPLTVPPASPASFAALHSVHPAIPSSWCFRKSPRPSKTSQELYTQFGDQDLILLHLLFLVTSHLIMSWVESKSFHAFLCYFVQIIKKIIQLELKSYITVTDVICLKTSVPTLLLNLAAPQIEEVVVNHL